MPQVRVTAEQLNVLSVADGIAADPTAIEAIATGVIAEPAAAAMFDAEYLRLDGTVLMEGNLDLGTFDLITTGTVDGRAVGADGIVLDGHVGNDGIHRVINDSGTLTTELFSASKIIADLALKSDTGHVHVAADVTSGTFADARIAVSNVSQHVAAIDHDLLLNFDPNEHFTQGAISITESQISDLQSYALIGHSHDLDNLNNVSVAAATNGQVLTYNLGTTTWEAVSPVSGVTDHLLLSNIGTNSHAQIDTHLADATIHRVINDSGTLTTELFSASKIIADLALKSDTGHVHVAADVTSGTFADARIAVSNVSQHVAAIDHDLLLNFDPNEHFTEGSINHANIVGIGTNSHAQIDTHLADATIHRVINDSGTSATELFSASKIIADLALKADLLSPTFTGLPVLPTIAKAGLTLGSGLAGEPIGSTVYVTDDAASPVFIMAWVDGTSTWVRSDTGVAIV